MLKLKHLTFLTDGTYNLEYLAVIAVSRLSNQVNRDRENKI